MVEQWSDINTDGKGSRVEGRDAVRGTCGAPPPRHTLGDGDVVPYQRVIPVSV